MSEDDAELVAALRRGDEIAFRSVFELYHPALVRAARTCVRTQSVAEEVVQDTWLAVIRGVETFEGRSSFKTWLFRILFNQARSRGTRESRTTPMSSLASDDERSVAVDRFES
jgi:RNA polymerase sigma-70 factor (ECF subfamily)